MMDPNTQLWRSTYYAYLRWVVMPLPDGRFALGVDNNDPWEVVEAHEVADAIRRLAPRAHEEHQRRAETPELPPAFELPLNLNLEIKL